MKLITVTVDRNMLMQLVESCKTQAEDMEAELDTLDADLVADVEKDAAWLRQCADHVETAVSNV